VEALPDVNGGKIFRAQVFGKWKVVYQRDGELGGVFDAADAGRRGRLSKSICAARLSEDC
jgi:predicted secreted protein